MHFKSIVLAAVCSVARGGSWRQCFMSIFDFFVFLYLRVFESVAVQQCVVGQEEQVAGDSDP